MKKKVTRVFTMLLALVMLFSMSAMAEKEQYSIEINEKGVRLFDGILTYGFDEDGCEEITFENSMLGKWLLQTDGAEFTIGSEEFGYYTINVNDLLGAIENVADALSAGEGFDMETLMEAMPKTEMEKYLESRAFEADLEVIEQILTGELNRIAAVAVTMGLVTIHENGDLEIAVSIDKLFAVFSAYLNQLSLDKDTIDSIFALGIFEALEQDVEGAADVIQAELKALAAHIEKLGEEVAQKKGGSLDLFIAAETGAVNVKFHVCDKVEGVEVKTFDLAFSYDGDNLKLDVDNKTSDLEGNLSASYVISTGAVSYEENVTVGEEKAHYLYKADENSTEFEAMVDTELLKGEGKIVSNESGINGEWDFAGEGVLFAGSINCDYAAETLSFKLNAVVDNDSIKADIEWNEELEAELTVVANGAVVCDWNISGTDKLIVKGNWMINGTNYDLDASMDEENDVLTVEGTLQIGAQILTASYISNIPENSKTVKVSGEYGVNEFEYEFNYRETETDIVAVGHTYIKNQRNTITSTAMTTLYGETNEFSRGVVVDINGRMFGVNYYCCDEGAEILFARDKETYRLYCDGGMTENGFSYIAGLAFDDEGNLEALADIISLGVDAELIEEELTIEAVLNSALGFAGTLLLDRDNIKLDVTVGEETTTFEGKHVVEENNEYAVFTGMIEGVAFEATIGEEEIEEGHVRYYAEVLADAEIVFEASCHLLDYEDGIAVEIYGDSIAASDGEKLVISAGIVADEEEENTFNAFIIVNGEEPEHVVAANAKITVIDTEDEALFKLAVTVADGEQEIELGDITLGYKLLAEVIEHIEGERFTEEMITEGILDLIESAMFVPTEGDAEAVYFTDEDMAELSEEEWLEMLEMFQMSEEEWLEMLEMLEEGMDEEGLLDEGLFDEELPEEETSEVE